MGNCCFYGCCSTYEGLHLPPDLSYHTICMASEKVATMLTDVRSGLAYYLQTERVVHGDERWKRLQLIFVQQMNGMSDWDIADPPEPPGYKQWLSKILKEIDDVNGDDGIDEGCTCDSKRDWLRRNSRAVRNVSNGNSRLTCLALVYDYRRRFA